MDKPASIDRLWTIEDVADYLRVPVETVRAWRKNGSGPPARKLGKHLRYDPAAVRRWATADAA
ncbi:DNA binding domain-containing protein, excisionase family [Actinokineospora alba]|uniref:DNA binding domain-containing protein, excisionase family n=1 Tax=Actinokineospora alba TaxID=504798 RepID=A0A1H0LGX7_9PSEU|nr:helix-turn-helix domain-containing protein [Actinokineospora alba]TDP67319.1 excisionase family DNA binding protein [Actinokineospora alba]SDJ00515.1 DNA binding domain-containing protein, excisionase family [Actinokineospora alba]SDO67271.1 DNA binding domain-containing protein, excisionase family [Actinokineospora alba]